MSKAIAAAAIGKSRRKSQTAGLHCGRISAIGLRSGIGRCLDRSLFLARPEIRPDHLLLEGRGRVAAEPSKNARLTGGGLDDEDEEDGVARRGAARGRGGDQRGGRDSVEVHHRAQAAGRRVHPWRIGRAVISARVSTARVATRTRTRSSQPPHAAGSRSRS